MGGLLVYLLYGVIFTVAMVLIDKFTLKAIRKWDQDFVPAAMIITTIFWPMAALIALVVGTFLSLYHGFRLLYKVIS